MVALTHIGNPIVLLMLSVSFFLYAVLIDILFFSYKCERWYERATCWNKALKILVVTLPLFGLLGTILGLMETFSALSKNSGMDLQSLMTHGIAIAMFSTQCGLALAIPAHLMLLKLKNDMKKYRLTVYEK